MMKDKIYEKFNGSFRPKSFASWARPKAEDLNIKRKRTLDEVGRVVWDIENEPDESYDHIEMAGFYASAIISYGKDKKGELRLFRHLTVPTLRFQPNVTQSSFSHNFKTSGMKIKCASTLLREYPLKIYIKGNLKIQSKTNVPGLEIQREFLPAVDEKALIEKVTIKNNGSSSRDVTVAFENYQKKMTEFFCVDGAISSKIKTFSDKNANFTKASENESFTLKKDEEKNFYTLYYSFSEKKPMKDFDIEKEIQKRRDFVENMFSSLTLKTPYEILDAQFSHCMLRGCESIFETKNGLMHAPGGGNYYAALWTNDQCEYANPFFPFSGYEKGIEEAVNCYRLFGEYMDKSEAPMKDKTALVTSITSEGISFWNGAGDRGDGEMYAYGLSRFLLALGDKVLMKEFSENLKWCIDFAFSRKNEEGVIKSDADELENRFESGSANLFTSCLLYDALENCALIFDILGEEDTAKFYRAEREILSENIEKYFGANVEGFDTYRYCKEEPNLRAWICMPLTVGIFSRKDETIKALYSDKLYKDGMLKSTTASETTWDRSLLFALRGTFLCGEGEIAMKETLNYCRNRLLGSHCPYPFEAFPEGNRAHLAAESLLFCRIITEGLFGLQSVGFKKLKISPKLLDEGEYILSGLKLYGKDFDVSFFGNKITVTFSGKKYIAEKKEAVFDFEKMAFDE